MKWILQADGTMLFKLIDQHGFQQFIEFNLLHV